MKTQFTPGPWKTYFNKTSGFPKGDWQVKADNLAETPIAVLPEPIGGTKGEDGLSPKQKENANLIAAAPESLEALVQCKKALEVVN